jgi:prepilin-type N-terminal cleavage/methylation domain-containing protein
MRNLRNNKGFTLIELMIVVVIIGILAAIAIPRFTSVSEGAKQAEAEPILKQMCSLAEAYELRYGAFPDGAAAAAAGGTGPALGTAGWSDPQAEYYGTWTLTAATRSATATKTAAATATMLTPTMDCDTKDIAWI